MDCNRAVAETGAAVARRALASPMAAPGDCVRLCRSLGAHRRDLCRHQAPHVRFRSRPASLRSTSSGRLFGVALGLTLLPLLVSGIALVVDVGNSYLPTADYAYTELLTRDVGHHQVLTGLFSRQEWNHPGPALYYLLALPYRLTGGASIGLHLGVLLINAAAIAGMAAIARRRGGTPLMLLTLVGCGLLVRSLGIEVVGNPWNCFMPSCPSGCSSC